MAALTFPHTLTNGNANDASEVMANFNAIKNHPWETSELASPYGLFAINFPVPQLVVGTKETVRHRVVVPAGITVVFVSGHLAVDTITDTPQLDLTVYKTSESAANEIFSADLSVTAADTDDTTTSFDVASVAGGTVLIFKFELVSAGGTDQVDNVSATLWCKALHQAA